MRSKMLSLHERFMRQAIIRAQQGIKKGQTPFGACIVKQGKIISCEYNTVWKNTDITSHAEIHAIRVACKKLDAIDLSGCTMYSTCEPCPMCFSACHWARISCIVYGATIRDARKAGFNELAIATQAMKRQGKSPVRIIGNILKKENQHLFTLWLERTDKRVY